MWRPTRALRELVRQVSFEEQFFLDPEQRYHGQGLGFGRKAPTDEKTQVLRALHRNLADEALAHTLSLERNGKWAQWTQFTPFNLSWDVLINARSPKLIAFVLNCFVNTVPSPDMLKLWGYQERADCRLCGHAQCTLMHCLVGCTVALRQGRYTWRHDSVLNTLKPTLSQHLAEHNRLATPKPPGQCMSLPPIAFVAAGAKKRPPRPRRRHPILEAAVDWQLLVDFDGFPIVFPPNICATDKRPDIVIWSNTAKIVLWAELTCPSEDNISDAQQRKAERYSDLAQQSREAGWTVFDLTIEVGARGCVAPTFNRFLRIIGFSPKQVRSMVNSAATTVARCSYAIFLASKNKSWPKHGLVGSDGP